MPMFTLNDHVIDKHGKTGTVAKIVSQTKGLIKYPDGSFKTYPFHTLKLADATAPEQVSDHLDEIMDNLDNELDFDA